MKNQYKPEYEAMLFLYDYVDPLMMDKLSTEARMLLQPDCNRKKIEFKEQLASGNFAKNKASRPLYAEVKQ